MKANKVIVAVSMEEETQHPLHQMKNLHFSQDTEIHLIHVMPVVLYARGMDLHVLTHPLEEERPKIVETVTEKLQKLAKDIFPEYTNIVYECLFDTNEKAAFCDYVQRQKADLVVVATRGKHGLKNFFDSSFAQHQLKHSPTNVLVLR